MCVCVHFPGDLELLSAVIAVIGDRKWSIVQVSRRV